MKDSLRPLTITIIFLVILSLLVLSTVCRLYLPPLIVVLNNMCLSLLPFSSHNQAKKRKEEEESEKEGSARGKQKSMKMTSLPTESCRERRESCTAAAVD